MVWQRVAAFACFFVKAVKGAIGARCCVSNRSIGRGVWIVNKQTGRCLHGLCVHESAFVDFVITSFVCYLNLKFTFLL